jgi:hypothetical protein
VDNIDDVRSQIVDELTERKTQENIAKVFEQLKGNTHVINYLAKTNSHPDPTVNPASKGSAIKQTSGERPAETTPRSKTASSAASNRSK